MSEGVCYMLLLLLACTLYYMQGLLLFTSRKMHVYTRLTSMAILIVVIVVVLVKVI